VYEDHVGKPAKEFDIPETPGVGMDKWEGDPVDAPTKYYRKLWENYVSGNKDNGGRKKCGERVVATVWQSWTCALKKARLICWWVFERKWRQHQDHDEKA
jgi:hypothetical protein